MERLSTRSWSLARLCGAGLLAGTGAIHLDLYLTGYRTIATIGWLFLCQVIAAFAFAVALLGLSSRLLTASAALFLASTLGGYGLSVWFGLFGFKEVRTSAGFVAGVIEALGFAMLSLATVAPARGEQEAPWTRPGSRSVRLLKHRTAQWRLAGVASAAVFTVLISALASAASAPATSVGGNGEVKARLIAGRLVLTDTKGFTLYLFVPDSASKSRCYGTCAVYWPPVLGAPTAGPGVTGRLGTITRSDGSLQATYDGHPLYSYVADSAPGQANGNAIDLNGGYWYEMTVSGKQP